MRDEENNPSQPAAARSAQRRSRLPLRSSVTFHVQDELLVANQAGVFSFVAA
jgi:hypothetical protein